MGGATARVPAGETAFWYRQAAHKLDVQVEWTSGEPDVHREWVRSTCQAVSHASAGGGYVNFMGDGEAADSVRAAYGGNYERLARVKGAYDPGNFFHLNHNVVPA
jgi:hypothetical protein